MLTVAAPIERIAEPSDVVHAAGPANCAPGTSSAGRVPPRSAGKYPAKRKLPGGPALRGPPSLTQTRPVGCGGRIGAPGPDHLVGVLSTTSLRHCRQRANGGPQPQAARARSDSGRRRGVGTSLYLPCAGARARFLTLDEVAEELAISGSQAYALGRSGDLPAL